MPPLNAGAQDETKHDPLVGPFGQYPFWANSVEILSLTDSITGVPGQIPSERIFDLTTKGEIEESSPYIPGSGSYELDNSLWLDCIAADFDGDGKDEVLTGWVSQDKVLHLDMSEATRLKPSRTWQWNAKLTFDDIYECNGPIKLLSANLDSSARKEIIICVPTRNLYYPQYNDLKVIPFFMDDEGQNLNPGTAVNFTSGSPYDIAAADLNGDGQDELVQVYHSITNYTDHSMAITRYNYNPASKRFGFVEGVGKITTNEQWNSWKRLKVTTGDFRNIGHDEVVISLTLINGNSGRQVFDYIPVSSGFDGWPSPPGVSPSGWSWGNGWESDAFAADLNPDKNDGDELVIAGPDEVAVLKFNASLEPYYCGGGNAKIPFLYGSILEDYPRRRFLAVEDMDADTSDTAWIKEIIVAEHKQDSTTAFRVLTPDINASNDITGLSEKALYNSAVKSRRSEITIGDFDGDAIRLGAPRLITREGIYQPIVQLNVPPTHFDYLNGQVYDICKVHGTTPSEFKVTYTETQSQTSHFSSELQQGWGVSTELSGGFSLFGVKVRSYVKAAYDRGYYGSHSQNTTMTASQVTSSTGDDWILATVTDYDFWEYPLYAMGERVADILVQVPHSRGTEWFPARNVHARNWMEKHEVGNLFSYPTKDEIADWVGDNLLTSFTGKYVSIASSGSWTLDLESQSIDTDKLTNKIGTEVGASVEGWGIEAKMSGKYSREEIITHTSTATKEVVIEVEVSETDKTFGDTDYLVTPYIYWGQNGAMVIDYAVDPSSSLDPVYGTFWDKSYLSKSDPGLILPWRLDSFKGIGGTEEIKLYCKSLHVSPMVLSIDDTAYIKADIHNFSLKNTDGPVTVRFYLGNPENEGTPIEGIDGQVNLSTGGSIPAQGRATMEMQWLVPAGLSENTQVYAVIDPDNVVDEIHEDNNIGFVPINVQGTTAVEENPNLPWLSIISSIRIIPISSTR